jgi:hypothetical protein
MSKQNTIKQHYVPRAFLSRWCDEKEVFFPIKIHRHTPPKLETLQKTGVYPFCCEKYFYANKKGKKDDFSQIVEDGFTEAEKEIYPIIENFESKVLNNKEITLEDKIQLSSVMLFLHLRGKQYLEWSRQSSEDMSKKIFEMNLRFKKNNISEKEILDILKEVKVDFGTAHHLKSLENITEFSYYLANKYWKIYISKNNDFIVTDTPYLDLPSKTKGFFSNTIMDREQFFILSPKIHISLLKPDNINSKNTNRKDITNYSNIVDYLNMISLMNSVQFGFHNKEEVLNRLKTITQAYYEHKKPDGYL